MYYIEAIKTILECDTVTAWLIVIMAPGAVVVCCMADGIFGKWQGAKNDIT